METAVRKATRLDYNPPKLKHLLTLKTMTFENPASIDGILMMLEKRLKERTWTVTYKVLTVVHYLMREGNCVRVVDGVVKRPGVLDASRIKNKSSVPASVHNIYLYRAYLDERVVAFRHLRRDYVSEETESKGQGRLRHLSIKDGLLKELASLQRQMESCVKCNFYLEEGDPSIALFSYRMTIQDLLAVFQAVNEGITNLLEHYFELSKPLAKTSFEIYKKFVEQTELTINFLNIARKVQSELEIEIPTIKHAPLTLSNALEEYLKESATTNSNEKFISQETPVVSPIKSEQPPPIPQQLQQQQSTSDSNAGQSSTNDFFGSVLNEHVTVNHPIGQSVSTQQSGSLSPQNPFIPLMRSLSQSPIPTQFASPFINNNAFTQPLSAPISPTHPNGIHGRPGRSDSNPFRAMSNPNLIANYQNPLIRSMTNPDLTANFQDPNITGYYNNKAQAANPFSPIITPPMTPNQAFPPSEMMANQQQQNTISSNHLNPFNNNTLHHTASI